MNIVIHFPIWHRFHLRKHFSICTLICSEICFITDFIRKCLTFRYYTLDSIFFKFLLISFFDQLTLYETHPILHALFFYNFYYLFTTNHYIVTIFYYDFYLSLSFIFIIINYLIISIIIIMLKIACSYKNVKIQVFLQIFILI